MAIKTQEDMLGNMAGKSLDQSHPGSCKRTPRPHAGHANGRIPGSPRALQPVCPHVQLQDPTRAQPEDPGSARRIRWARGRSWVDSRATGPPPHQALPSNVLLNNGLPRRAGGHTLYSLNCSQGCPGLAPRKGHCRGEETRF